MRRNTAILLEAINNSHGEGRPGSRDGPPGAQLFGSHRNFGVTPGAVKKSLQKEGSERGGGGFGGAGTHEHHPTYKSYTDFEEITHSDSNVSDPFPHVSPAVGSLGSSGSDLIASQMSGPNQGYMSPSAAAFHRIQGLANNPGD